MKNAKKLILLALCAVLLVGASVMGTLAYLQMQTETVTNTFTVGNVTIALKEYGLNDDGTKNATELDASTTTVNVDNIKLVPGRTIQKHPFVTVAAKSEKCYLFVKVVNNIAGVESTEADYDNLAKQMSANGWTALTGVTDVYYKVVETSTAEQKFDIFTAFKVNPEATNESIKDYAGKTIDITAYAIQFEGFATPEAAWTAGSFPNT